MMSVTSDGNGFGGTTAVVELGCLDVVCSGFLFLDVVLGVVVTDEDSD